MSLTVFTLAAFLGLAGLNAVKAQDSPLSNFSFPSEPYSVCLNEPVRIDNLSKNAVEYLWDFCPETFTEEAVKSPAIPIPGLANGWSYKIVKHEDLWTGFLLSRETNKLFRLEFGADAASEPSIYDLGNPGDLLVSPQGLDIVNQNGNWYAFVGKGQTTTGQIVRLDFGSSLHNTPNAVGLGAFGVSGSRFRDLKVVRQGSDLILLVVLDTQNALLRINYRDSFNNAISAMNISKTGTLTGASLPLGFSVVKHSGNWIVHTVSFSNNAIQQYNFGSDILGTPAFEGTFTFSSVARPYYIKIIREGESFYGFVGNESKKLSIIKFGNFDAEPQELPNSSLPAFIGFDILKDQSKNILHGAVTGTATVMQVSFENNACSVGKTWAREAIPLNVLYNTQGSYPIELAVEGYDGQYDVSSKTLNVSTLSAPQLEIEHDNSCLDAPITFQVISPSTLSEFNWDFGDNMTSDDREPKHQYNAQGVYTVKLDVKDVNNCMNVAHRSISIYPTPSPSFTLPASLICTNNEFLFPTTSPDAYDGHLSYEWYVDDNPVGTERDLKYTFTSTGPKQIKLKTSIPGCSDEIIQTTSFVQAGPVVDFSYTGVCEDETFYFQNQISEPVESYQWQFGTSETSTDPDPVYTFTDFGAYSVSLTATNATGCENTKTKTITVRSLPVVDFNAEGPPNTCTGTETTFQNLTTTVEGDDIAIWKWEFNDPHDLTSNNDQHAKHRFRQPGIYSTTLAATSEYGCSARITKGVLILQSPSAEFNHSVACEASPVSFSRGSIEDIAHTYWEIGTSYYYDTSPVHTFKTPGDYPVYLEVIGTNGCIAEKSTSIHVPVPLSPDFSVIKNCVDQQAIFTDITSGVDPVVSRSWNFDPGGHIAGEEVAVTFQNTGNVSATLKVTGVSGCSYETTRPIAILPAPHASFAATPSTGGYPLEVQFVNTSLNATDYLWNFGSETSTDALPVHTFQEAGEFEVKLTAFNEQQCQHTTTNIITTVAPLPDADVDLITLSENNDGTYRLIITIHNKGNTYLRDLPVDIDFGGNLQLREVVQQTIAPSSKYNLVLGTDILKPDILEYLCVSMDVSNDVNTPGNRKCLRLEDDLYIFDAFPNPASQDVAIEWISGSSKDLQISLVDQMGRMLLAKPVSSLIGLNRQVIDVGNMKSGIYFLFIEDGLTRHHQRILVFNNR